MHIASPQVSLFENSAAGSGGLWDASNLRIQCRTRSLCDHAGHLHFFVRGDQNFVLGNWVKGLKRAILKAFPNEKDHSLWQPGFFDHLLRNDESYAQKWEYVRENPVRAGLVHCSEDWPYQGEIVYIDRA